MKRRGSQRRTGSSSRNSSAAGKRTTPELPEEAELHPNLEDDPGAWGDQDTDWILNGRMPN